MGAHSDQAQDLLESSVIAVCSFYSRPENVDATRPPRMLLVEAKDAHFLGLGNEELNVKQ